jgi:rhodanese-related sulfurtransferase
MKMPNALKSIDARAAADLMRDGALMVDVREPGEHAQARIPGSTNIPLSRFELSELSLEPDQAVVFFCASGNRTSFSAARLVAKAGGADAYVMQGGISAWGRAGLPVEPGHGRQERQAATAPGFLSRMFQR